MRRAQRNTAFYKVLLALFLATFLLAARPGKGYYLQRERYGRDDPDPDRELQ